MRSRGAPPDTLTLLGRLTSFFAIPATHGEWKGPEAMPGDLRAALDTVPVVPSLESPQCRVDLVERLGLHLDQRKSDRVLDVDLELSP